MANQNTPEMQEAKLSPSDDGQPPIMAQYDTSPDPHVGPREALEGHGDHEESPDPSPQHNSQPQDLTKAPPMWKEKTFFLGCPSQESFGG
ncbi:hypothetical protein D623_10000941 [Myotis brandtii]|uniref:Uncharacterized protein n=1 Tax=Myotis brandtii TaxID=109478 RepID=S7MTD1_MYOBR|nr:hypothetical protein D623_10000941 [Myotis brandtii]